MKPLLLAGAAIAALVTLSAPGAHASPFNDPSLANGGVCPSFYTAIYCEFERDADAEWELGEQQFAKCKLQDTAESFAWGRYMVDCMTAAGYPEKLSNHSLSGTIKRVVNKWRAASRPASDLEYGANYYKRMLDAENPPPATPYNGAKEGFPQTFANAEAFNSEYDKTVAALTAMGIRVEKTCGADYCANVMVYAGPARANSVYDVTKTDGSRWRKICAGDSTLRQCAFSDGAIVEETLKDREWKLARTVASGFGR